jgi:hypothetical protein
LKKTLILLIAASILASSCAMTTIVTIDTEPPKANVYIDNRDVGETPVSIQMSNAFWEEPDILIRKEGYRDLRTLPNKEIKVINLISGLLLIWPSLLWVWGPEENQVFTLIED